MSDSGADVFRTVVYSRDKWTMSRVPLALLLGLAGLVLVVFLDPRPPDRRSVILFLFHMADGLIGPWYSRMPAAPGNVLGMAMIIGAIGWIGFAVFRHFRPARPILTLSPAGISFHISWLKDLLIPWHEVQAVDALETAAHGSFPQRFPDTTVVVVSDGFYRQHILPKRPFLAGRFWKQVFWPKRESMQMVLHHGLFSIGPKDIREPVEARWKAFRGAPPSMPPDAGPALQAHQVYGAWSIDGSLWQTATFVVPLVGIAAVLAAAVWPP
jgi:hypothetical protein